MADVPGDRFVSKGIEYILRIGPKGNLRPYVLGRIALTGLRVAGPVIVVVGVVALLAIGTVALARAIHRARN